MSDTVEKIKERLTIVDVVQPYVKLTRAGKYWKGLSPFTREKTPSFFVSPDRGLYHCFSTGRGGDMFTFVEEMERVDFKGALRILADKAGVDIEREAPGARDERDQIYAALEAATVFYQDALRARPDAHEYLTKRGIEDATLAHFRVGYAPKDWRALKDHLMGQGIPESALFSAGLIKRPDTAEGESGSKNAYDRFRGRIMFPIFDVSGRVIAFSGRIFEDDPAHPQAKYINSPEGPLFDKSRALYGLHDAKGGIRTLGFSMLVEGQVDLILSHQLGYKNAVATSGTALTASHVEILKRYSDKILLAYDGDKAGVAATYRAAELLFPAHMNVKAVALPPGVDPADQIRDNPEAFKNAVRTAEPVIDFFVEHIRKTVSDDRARRIEVGSMVLPLVAKIDNALEQSHFVGRIASALGAPEDAVRTELLKIRTVGTSMPTATKDPFFADSVRQTLLFGVYATYREAKDERADRVRALFIAEFGESQFETLLARSESETETARMLASEQFFELHLTRDAENEALVELEREGRPRAKIGTELATLRAALKQADTVGNEVEVARLMSEITNLSKGLN